MLYLFSAKLHAQTDYSNLLNWYFHPDKLVNILANYNLDVAVIAKDLSVTETLDIPNRSTEDTGVDVFWVHPTQLVNPPDFPTTIPLDDQPASVIVPTIIAQGGLLAQYGRFFAPRYRQASPAAFLDGSFSEGERSEALADAYSDVKAAFQYYMENYNGGNRVILAGHSQGSYHLGMLLSELFDDSPEWQDLLITASLGGMAYAYAGQSELVGGWWENIPLCSEINQCGCIHNWRSFKETQFIPNLATALPPFNSSLVDSGLVHRTLDVETDQVILDSVFYGPESSPLRYYITPSANFDPEVGTNFVAFDSMFTVRMKRTSNVKAVLAVDYVDDPADMRPNDLLPIEGQLDFLFMGFHQKDYNIYSWALTQQIDAKLEGCAMEPSSNDEVSSGNANWMIFPNPSTGEFFLRLNDTRLIGDRAQLINIHGQVVQTFVLSSEQVPIRVEQSGLYILRIGQRYKRLLVR
ncbi:MAG: DUF3089 domain-containing protein [Bacteroidota bacterium]